MLDLDTLNAAADIVYRNLLPTPQLQWPLLNARCGHTVWVKHENHNPTGAFKVRGGLVYLHHLQQRQPDLHGVVSATRGNHGQSIALAAAKYGMRAVIVVPHGNNPDKNRAMRALGAELIEHGADFDEAVPFAAELARERGYHRIPSFHEDLVAGVASYSLELLKAAPDLARVYVPIGLGSGICGMIAARNALKRDTQIIGVVSENASAYRDSFLQGECVSTATANTYADGVAVRNPDPAALNMMLDNIERIVSVSDSAVFDATRTIFQDCHNVAEGAGAIALAGLLADNEDKTDHSPAGIVLSGGNASQDAYARILAGENL